jgi:hypothetical protein
MTQTLWLQIGLTVLLGSALIVLAAGIRRRKHREWLSKLSSKYSLGVVEGSASREATQLAAMYENQRGRLRLDSLLVGSDDYGRFFAGERRWRRRRESVLFFDSEEGTHLRSFSFRPARPSNLWFRRLFGRLRRSRSKSSEEPGYTLHWSAPRPQWSDERGLAAAARVLFHTAEVFEESPLSALHLHIEQRRVLIRCERRLTGKDLDAFLADATALRRRILKSLRKVQETKGSRRVDRPSRSLPSVSEQTVQVLR